MDRLLRGGTLLLDGFLVARCRGWPRHVIVSAGWLPLRPGLSKPHRLEDNAGTKVFLWLLQWRQEAQRGGSEARSKRGAMRALLTGSLRSHGLSTHAPSPHRLLLQLLPCSSERCLSAKEEAMEVARRHRVGRPLSEHSATSEWSFQQLSAKAQRLIHLWSFCERDARGIRVCGDMDERP